MRTYTTGCLVAIFLLLSACFNVREPEKPSSQSEWNSPTQPYILLDNFTAAVQTLNVTLYERCLIGPAFRFLPDATTAGNSSALFTQWGINEEREYFNSLAKRMAPNGKRELRLLNKKEVFFSADSLEVTTHYELLLVHQDSTLPHQNFEGDMRLLLKRNNNEWKISSWQDARTSSDRPCWSDLKKHFITH
ncbi:MAG: hypothetical protein LPK19_15735 [Hymenobacteraceae bacterium]|nr:hypothetical protein [Hymenobacteraceae bacterium]MDX5397688.1 hypothetical protein [Hymenobacteraceae bacterium]MDX5513766.1 hypothetical protein [Hymenobacteraceae bacterium]